MKLAVIPWDTLIVSIVAFAAGAVCGRWSRARNGVWPAR